MQQIVYYIASSIDGYIAGKDDDISGFVMTGNGVEKYLAELQDFTTVIMGRKTYEFGYKHGLSPGQPAYPHMTHFIFSDSLQFENADPKVNVVKRDISELEKIQQLATSNIYLCGGGQFAGWLLDQQKIDVIKLKLNPLIQGQGTRLFGDSKSSYTLEFVDSEAYENGLQIMTYHVKYNKN
ncbi:MAG: dihydrofolate reductase family protein [Spirochaetota bacterium]